MRMPFFKISLLTAAIALSACSSNKPQTLGSLKYKPEPEPEVKQVSQVTPESVRTEYQELLDIIDDDGLKEQIERRIAHVYMLEGGQDQVDANGQTPVTPDKSYYVEAIKSYRDILEKYPNSPDNAEILYQLAKAYDMEGNQDEALNMLLELTRRHPYYENIAEANFRKGDILFNRGEYRDAETAYREVTNHPESKFILNAHYMLGWAQYKQLEYRSSLNAFVHVLNTLIQNQSTLDNLSKPDQSLATDTLHAVSLSLDKLAGAATIESLAELRGKDYVWLVYDNLGQYYLDKELFEASAETYRLFVKEYANLDRTPIMHKKMIDTYVEGAFPQQAFQEKENYVDAYGIYSSFAKQRGGLLSVTKDTMQEYLDELARNYHARGQEVQKQMAELAEKDKQNQRADKYQEMDEDAIASLDKAAYYYLQFVETFPDYEKLDEMIFFRADALYAARRFDKSIPDYEKVAYNGTTPIADEYGANAGYAAISAYEEHIKTLTADSAVDQWRSQAVDSMLRFAEKYHQDNRSASVLTNAAEYIFSLEQYPRALSVAQGLIDSNPDLDNTLKKTAYGIMGHSLFKLERFDEARDAYLSQRGLVDADTEEHQQITERLASAIYKNSETIVSGEAREDKEQAVAELLKLKTLTPDSPVRITGQYDAASLLIELESWPKAIEELKELKALFPEHELATEFPRKLAFAYEKNEDWSLAANEYMALAENDPELALRREALFLAATMYENAKNFDQSIQQFKSYNKLYPEPYANMMEARFHLASNYQTINDQEKKRYWLDQLVDGHVEAGSNQTDRTNYLAAWANAEFGDYYAKEFSAISLTLPLDKSVQEKYSRLEKASERYQAAADSALFEFITMSAYKMGELYQNFAQDLRRSPRPSGLSSEEKALYSEILEEQAGPLDNLAMDLHQSNIQRAWDGEFNNWINRSYDLMSQLNPQRFAKTELIVSYGDEIR